MGIVRWVKHHPWEAAALAAAAVATGGMALAPEAAVAAGAAGAAGAGEAAAAAAAAEAAAAGSPALLGAGAGGASLGAEAAAGFGGEAVSGLAASHLAGAGAGLGAESALLSAYPLGEDFAAQMAGQSMAGGMPGQFASAGGAEASLYDPAQLANPQTAMGPRESTWLSRMSPKNVMSLGMMAAQLGSRPQGGPAPMSGPPQMRQANMTQEDITKKWLMQNDPNTYRRIYGNPQGVA